MYRLLILLLLFAGCTPQLSLTEEAKKKADSIAFLTVVVSAENGVSEIDTPDTPKPVSDKCETCNGTGKVGDGRVFSICRDCNGSGKRVVSEQPKEESFKEATVEKQKIIGTIEFYSAPWCVYCPQWEKENQPAFESAGFEVKKLGYPVDGTIELDGKRISIGKLPFFVFKYEVAGKVRTKTFTGMVSLEYFQANS